MIVYNVTIKVEADVADEWVSWMKDEHIADVLSTGLFTECRLCRLLEQDEAEGVTFSAQYTCATLAEYNKYIDVHAPAMREKGFKRFGGRFVAFRSVMEVV
ncbi:DUF4286 family protein [Nemorincola caseinilytica]|uniref:DUF4286 family protein n=1 Tax=Nemorincola caseinilytica TaxID=2054315 RepID=A0ABP8NQ61_9BACT